MEWKKSINQKPYVDCLIEGRLKGYTPKDVHLTEFIRDLYRV